MNYNILESILDQFIPKTILFKVVIINQDSGGYKKYRPNFDTYNNKNNLQYMLAMAKIKDLGLLSDCIYTDVNKARQNLNIKLISIINNLQITATMVHNAS